MDRGLVEDGVTGIGKSVAERLERLGADLRKIDESWDKRFTGDEGMSAEQYLVGRFNIVFDVEFAAIVSEVYKRSWIAYESIVSKNDICSFVGCQNAVRHRQTADCDQEHVMLVPVAQFIQGDQGLVSAVGEISVRSYLVPKQAPRLGEGWTYRSLIDGRFKALNVVRDGHRAPTRIIGVNGSQQAHPGEVERSSQISAYVSGHKLEVCWDGLRKIDFENIAARLRVRFNRDGAWFCVEPAFDEGCKVLDVMVGPYDLLSGSLEGMSGLVHG